MQVPGLWPLVLVLASSLQAVPLLALGLAPPALEVPAGGSVLLLFCSAWRVGRHVALSRWWRQGRLSRVPPSDTLAFTHYFRAGKQVAPVGVWEGKAGSRQGRAAAWVPRERRSSPRARTAPALAWRTPQEPSARPMVQPLELPAPAPTGMVVSGAGAVDG